MYVKLKIRKAVGRKAEYYIMKCKHGFRFIRPTGIYLYRWIRIGSKGHLKLFGYMYYRFSWQKMLMS